VTASLSSRRAKITPQHAGLTTYSRNRRVPGLRRSEVADPAGVRVFDSVLDALARALQAEQAPWASSPAPPAPATRAHRNPAAHTIRPSVRRIPPRDDRDPGIRPQPTPRRPRRQPRPPTMVRFRVIRGITPRLASEGGFPLKSPGIPEISWPRSLQSSGRSWSSLTRPRPFDASQVTGSGVGVRRRGVVQRARRLGPRSPLTIHGAGCIPRLRIGSCPHRARR